MGRAIVREPKAFLMDEPLSNLDAKLRVQMRTEIARIQHELNVTTIYVTHDQVEAMTMGDRVAVIRKGKLQQVDTPQRLYDHPVNLFVAGFIGSPAMNMVEATISTSNGAAIVEFGGHTLSVPPEVVASHAGLARFEGQTVVVGSATRGHRGCDRSFPRHRQDRRIRAVIDLRESLGADVVVALHGATRRRWSPRTRRSSHMMSGTTSSNPWSPPMRTTRSSWPGWAREPRRRRVSRSIWSWTSRACTSSIRRQAWRSTRTEPAPRRG